MGKVNKMNEVKIMIDSASDINASEAKSLGVIFMPIEVRFGDDEFLDGVNISRDEFFDRLTTSTELPKTSLINEFRWEEAFKEATKDGDEVVVISISSGLSGGYLSALAASKKYEGKVFVVDSLSAAVGERLLLQFALKLVGEGFSASEVAQKLNGAKTKLNIVAMVDTLKYLKMGGRISAATAFVGGMLSIKPIIAVIDGKVRNVGKAIGQNKAFAQIKSIIQNKGIDFSMPVGLIWSGKTPVGVDVFKRTCNDLWLNHMQDIPEFQMGCTIGTHVGPGAVGIAFFEK